MNGCGKTASAAVLPEKVPNEKRSRNKQDKTTHFSAFAVHGPVANETGVGGLVHEDFCSVSGAGLLDYRPARQTRVRSHHFCPQNRLPYTCGFLRGRPVRHSRLVYGVRVEELVRCC